MSNLIATEYQGFEQIKHTDDSGNEYWFARELAPHKNTKIGFADVSKTKNIKIGFPDVGKTKTKINA